MALRQGFILDLAGLTALGFAIAVLHDHSTLLLLLVTTACVLRLQTPNTTTATWAVALAGAVLGTGFDLLRISSGVYFYVGHAYFPAYMPLLWGYIALTLESLMAWIDADTHTDWSTRFSKREVLAMAMVFAVSVLGLHRIDGLHAWAAAGLAATFVLFVLVAGRAGDLRLGLMAAVLGPLTEFGLVRAGLHAFEVEATNSLPTWLWAVWPLYVVVLRRAFGKVRAFTGGRAGIVSEWG
jgi:hypothetical protein